MIGKLVSSLWFRTVLSATVLTGLLTHLDVQDAARAVASVAPGYLLATLAVGAAARSVMIFRWVVLLRTGGARVSGGSAARIFLVSSFVGTALPVGGADVARALALSRRDLGGTVATASVAVDRLVGVAALLTLAVFGLVLGMPDADSELARIVAGVSMGGALLAFGVLWADDLLGLVLPGRVRRTPVGTWLSVAAGEMARYRTRRGAIGVVFVLSLVVQWLRVTEVFLLGAGLGLDIGFGYYLVFMPVGLVAMMLPISIAGVGLPQGVIMWVLQPAGVGDAQAFALSALVVTVGVIGTLPGLCLYIRGRGSTP